MTDGDTESSQREPSHSDAAAGLHAVTRSSPRGTAGLARWADVIPLAKGRAALSIGVVEREGQPGEALTGRLRAAGRASADQGLVSSAALSTLDDLATAAETRATAVYAVHDSAAGSLDLASAGPCPPAIVTPCGSTTLLATAPSLGMRWPGYEPVSVPFPVGSSLVLYMHTVSCPSGPPREDRLKAQISQARLFARGRNSVGRVCAALVAALECGRPAHETTVLIAQPGEQGDDDRVQWFPGDPASAAAARGFALRAMDEWNLGDKANRAAVIVGELATNAIRHSASPFEIRLHRTPQAVTIEVADHSHEPPARAAAEPFEDGHRGLTIVETLADRWGSRPVADGKIVWAELRLEPRPGDEVFDPR